MKTRMIISTLALLCMLALTLGGGRAVAADLGADAVTPPPVVEPALPPDDGDPGIVVIDPGDLLTTDKPVRPPVDIFDTSAPGDLFYTDKPVRPPTSLEPECCQTYSPCSFGLAPHKEDRGAAHSLSPSGKVSVPSYRITPSLN